MSAIVGGLLALLVVGLLIGGVATVVADRTNRDAAGYLTSPMAAFSTAERALVSETWACTGAGAEVAVPGVGSRGRPVAGHQRGRIPPTSSSASHRPDRSLDTFGRRVLDRYGLPFRGATYTRQAGATPPTPPAEAGFSVPQASGTGPQSLTWSPSDGDWTILVMNADSSPGYQRAPTSPPPSRPSCGSGRPARG